jgi:hypothetical protein
MSVNGPDGLEEKMRDSMVRQLHQNLAKCRKIILNENMDLKTRERWTQLYNNTSQVLNQILKDRQMRDWEKRLQTIEEYEKGERSQTSPTQSKIANTDEQKTPPHHFSCITRKTVQTCRLARFARKPVHGGVRAKYQIERVTILKI